ncbi:VOC family protein [Enterococcus pseudoavium]|uniref:VOC family protein n=1 Tax=Enterococcus pseudoavium TaxID=44007 RepID=A0ABU3FG81_9ENTE|nr:VOC family protein [Enterococcus pseudoavium]MDT2755221.1 VOC family protein [Enterococcus pseudoavium]MDT2769829.1 VOC family protein [Enterococcus pseudoavium]
MHIEHVAIWTKDLEKMKEFYEKYFNVTSSALYHNQKTGFRSYFLSFDTGSRLELTSKQHLSNRVADSLGYTHIAISLGSKEAVDSYVEKFLDAGLPLLNGPRTTGDGYYETVIQDPEGNLLELTT